MKSANRASARNGARGEFVNDPFRDIHHVQLAGDVFAEGTDVERRQEQRARKPARADLRRFPDRAGAVVAVEIRALERRDLRAAVAIAAGDGAGAAGVGVLEQREGDAGIDAVGGRVVAVHPFHLSPAVVFAADARRRLEIDFLERVLADVSDPEVAGGAIETETPRIAQAVRPDFAAPAGTQIERIRGRNGVRRAVIDIDAQDLAEELIDVLGVVVRIAAGAAVSGADVQKTVRAELEL